MRAEKEAQAAGAGQMHAGRLRRRPVRNLAVNQKGLYGVPAELQARTDGTQQAEPKGGWDINIFGPCLLERFPAFPRTPQLGKQQL